jgi:hypothetical protein
MGQDAQGGPSAVTFPMIVAGDALRRPPADPLAGRVAGKTPGLDGAEMGMCDHPANVGGSRQARG